MDVNRSDDVVLRLAAAAYLHRYTDSPSVHSESDLRIYFASRAERDLAPLVVGRPQAELYVRWLHEVRRFQAVDCVAADGGRDRVLPALA